MSDARNLPQIEFIEVDVEQVKLKLKDNPTPFILKASGQDEGGERYYEELNSVRFNGAKDSQEAKLLENNPIFNLHAILDESTLYIGTLEAPVRIDVEGNFFARSIDLIRTKDGELFPMKLKGDQWVPVQG